MAKLIKKSKCTFEQGHIVKKGELVGIPGIVHMQLERLELMLQQYDYLKAQPAYSAGPSLRGFERKYDLNSDLPYVGLPDTPVTDKRVEEAMAFMAEVDSVDAANEINKAIDRFAELISWCQNDKFVEGMYTGKIDLHILGNPLELKAEDIVAALKVLVETPVAICCFVDDEDGDRPTGTTSGW